MTMFDLDEFQNQLRGIIEQFQLLADTGKVFGDKALHNFGIDVADLIMGINSFLEKSFDIFYSEIGCRIAGDLITSVTIGSGETVNDLYLTFQPITPPTAITLRFFISHPVMSRLQDLHEDVSIYIREDKYELDYNHEPIGTLNYPKEYCTNLLGEAEPIKKVIAQRFMQKITARVDS